MAPLTRSRARADGVPRSLLMAKYYAQRSSAGLIIAEGTNISAQARGYAFTPGLFTHAQVEGWQPVTEAVHAEGGRIFVQLWHVGRVSHPMLQSAGALPVSASAIRPAAEAFLEDGFAPCPTPRSLYTEEVPEVVAQYQLAAQNALNAGFDGVEIHAANGYLIEQFLRDSINQRSDIYGGSKENRVRLLLEVTEAVAKVCGGDRVGVRLSPVATVNDCDLDSDPGALYGYAVEQLNLFGLGYVHVIEGNTQGARDTVSFNYEALRRSFKGSYIANNGYARATAEEALRQNRADFISFGRFFIANPDLVARLRSNAPLKVANRATFFGGGAAGYTDYPSLATVEAAHLPRDSCVVTEIIDLNQ